MLTQLRIANYATIKTIELELNPGFNVLTGETGAGKSVIVGAAGLLLGGRAAADAVRSGAEQLEVEAIFDISGQPQVGSLLDQLGLSAGEQGELLVRRVVSRAGRSRVYVNGSLCTLAMLATITSQLLDIAGQHEHQSLSQRQTQLRILDDLAGTRSLREEMQSLHDLLQQRSSAVRQLEGEGHARTERIDFLRFQLQELDAAGLRPDEDGELATRHARLSRAAELYQAASTAERAIYSEEGAVVERLAALQRRLQELGRVDEALAPLARQIEEARLQLEDAALTLVRYAEGVDLDPGALEEVEQRLALLHRLTRKHGRSVSEIIAHVAQMHAELEELEAYDSRLEERQAQLEQTRVAAATIADRLAAARLKAARRLSTEASRHLQDLCMEGAKLVVVLEPRPPRQDDDPALVFGSRRLGPSGWDRAELHITTNAGEDPRPLARVASGGELSRVMLALRQVIGKYDPLSTSIYDEVDAGIGGKTADVVGRCLAEVAHHRQVLCVTHLPQVAAYARRHFHVGKGSRDGRTVTAVDALTADGRVEELARMLGGRRVTSQARANAAQLLAAADEALR